MNGNTAGFYPIPTFRELVSIRTPWNQKPIRSTAETRRVWRDGRWQRVDPEAGRVLRWLKG